MSRQRNFRKLGLLTLLILVNLAACGVFLSASNTPNPTPEITYTPTYENCFWNWAYGEGSPEFEVAVLDQFKNQGFPGTLKSSSYGEVYSCDQSYHAKDLDVTVVIQVESFGNQAVLNETAEKVFTILQECLPISSISNLGNVNLSFISADGNTCYWDKSSSQCAE